MSLTFRIEKDNTEKVKRELEAATERALTAVGVQAVFHTVANITEQGLVDTGNMRNSISSYVEGRTCYVGTPVEYAVYQELGTSRGIEPHYFLRDAITNHAAEYKDIVHDHLR